MNDMAIIKYIPRIRHYKCCAILKSQHYFKADYNSIIKIVQPTFSFGETKYKIVSLNSIINISPKSMVVKDSIDAVGETYYIILTHYLYRQIIRMRSYGY